MSYGSYCKKCRQYPHSCHCEVPDMWEETLTVIEDEPIKEVTPMSRKERRHKEKLERKGKKWIEPA